MTATTAPAAVYVPPAKVTADLPDGRRLIAYLDPTTPYAHSPLQRALRAADIHPHNPHPGAAPPTSPTP